MASKSRVLYTGVSSDLQKRVFEHKNGSREGFASRYKVTRLVYFQEFVDIRNAIRREKEIKGWSRADKVRFIEEKNPTWEYVAESWFKPYVLMSRKADPSSG